MGMPFGKSFSRRRNGTNLERGPSGKIFEIVLDIRGGRTGITTSPLVLLLPLLRYGYSHGGTQSLQSRGIGAGGGKTTQFFSGTSSGSRLNQVISSICFYVRE